MQENDINIDFISDEKSLIDKVKVLSDKNVKTLGMLPYQAFDEAVKKRNIIVAKIDNEVAGYILFRKVISRNQIVIVHFCIDSKYRNNGIGRSLFSTLLENSDGFSSIQLKCRRDYEAGKFWPKLGFTLIKTVQGRKKTGSELNIWYYKLDSNNLFDEYYKPDFNKLPIVLDSNIIIDFFNGTYETFIFEDWLDGELEYWITPEFFNELDSFEDRAERNRLINYARQNFKVLETTLNQEINCKLNELYCSKTKKSIEQDIRHLSHTIESGIQFFITNDHKDLINNKEHIASEFGIKLLTPQMLIAELDKYENPDKYSPVDIEGTDIIEEIGNPDLYDEIIQNFYNTSNGQKKSDFVAIISQAFENPNEFCISIFKKENRFLSLIVEQKNDNHIFIKLFRIANNYNYFTLQQHLLYHLLDKYSKQKIDKVSIIDSYMDLDDEIFASTFFMKEKDKWVKSFKYGVTNTSEYFNNSSNQIKSLNTIIKSERYFWPLKMADLNIKCYIVPIKLKWAIELFAKSLASETIFKHDEEKLLSRENVYYCNSSIEIKVPARILWYISGDNKRDSKFIGYSSFVDDFFKDYPKVLFKSFKRLGIYKWEDVYCTAKNNIDNKIKAFLFRDTEEFKNRVYLNSIRDIFENSEDKKLTLQSIVEIMPRTYIELYKLGMEYE
jgi:GNAT superfamily N-acetyltransferase